jgi:hypothetical protein
MSDLPQKEETPSDLPQKDYSKELIQSLEQIIDGKRITTALVMRMVADAIMISSEDPLSIYEKKTLISSVVEQLIRKSDIPQEEVDILMIPVDGLILKALDVVEDVTEAVSEKVKTSSCCIVM